MNRSLKFALLATAAIGVVAVAMAQSPPAAPTAPAAPATSAAPAPATPPGPAVVPAPPPAVSPERFEPTDKVRADFDVSFPIDI